MSRVSSCLTTHVTAAYAVPCTPCRCSGMGTPGRELAELGWSWSCGRGSCLMSRQCTQWTHPVHPTALAHDECLSIGAAASSPDCRGERRKKQGFSVCLHNAAGASTLPRCGCAVRFVRRTVTGASRDAVTACAHVGESLLRPAAVAQRVRRSAEGATHAYSLGRMGACACASPCDRDRPSGSYCTKHAMHEWQHGQACTRALRTEWAAKRAPLGESKACKHNFEQRRESTRPAAGGK